MRIAYLSLLPPPDQPATSGVHKVSESLLREFETLSDIEVEAVALIDGLPQRIVRTRGNVRYHYLPCKPYGKTATFYWREKAVLRRYVSGLSVNFIHGQPSSEYLLTATNMGLPHVITIHGLPRREGAGLSRVNPQLISVRIREFMQRRAIRLARNIITITPYVAKHLERLTNARFWAVNNPIDPEFFSVSPPPTNGKLKIICVGTVCARKNQNFVVEACARLRQRDVPFECHIIGSARLAYQRKIEARIQNLKLQAKVILTGPIGRDELLRQYEWANAVVLASREESSSLVLMQAMAAGRPAFGGVAAAIPDVLDQGSLGTLFSLDNVEALAGELEALQHCPDPFWQKSKIARKHLLDNFFAREIARRTLETYRQISGQSI